MAAGADASEIESDGASVDAAQAARRTLGSEKLGKGDLLKQLKTGCGNSIFGYAFESGREDKMFMSADAASEKRRQSEILPKTWTRRSRCCSWRRWERWPRWTRRSRCLPRWTRRPRCRPRWRR